MSWYALLTHLLQIVGINFGPPTLLVPVSAFAHNALAHPSDPDDAEHLDSFVVDPTRVAVMLDPRVKN